MSSKNNKHDPTSPLVWVDMEMTGLNPLRDHVLEIATLITDNDLNILAEGPEFVVHQSQELFNLMDDWNKEHHTKSGLWKKVIESNISLKDAESLTLDFIKKYCRERKSPLCGNSIWQDRRFLCHHMPILESYLHYRCIDVSTLKELTLRWYPKDKPNQEKKSAHRAMDDIRESIEELKYYRKHFLKV